jgi:hypothetical protein
LAGRAGQVTLAVLINGLDPAPWPTGLHAPAPPTRRVGSSSPARPRRQPDRCNFLASYADPGQGSKLGPLFPKSRSRSWHPRTPVETALLANHGAVGAQMCLRWRINALARPRSFRGLPLSKKSQRRAGPLSRRPPILSCHALQWAPESAERVGRPGPAEQVQPWPMRPSARPRREQPRCRAPPR